VVLLVTASDGDWVDLATLRLKGRLDTGARATGRVETAVFIGFGACVVIAFVVVFTLGDDLKGLNAGEIASIVLFAVSGVLLLISASLRSIAPGLELVADGRNTRWDRLRARARVSGKWIADAVVKGGIGAVIGFALARFFG
jgi:hypothetical protein